MTEKDSVTTQPGTVNQDLTNSEEKISEASISPWQLAFYRLLQNRLALFGLGLVCLMLLVILCAPLLTGYDPTAMDYEAIQKAPGQEHLMGTDDLGRDIFARVLYGGRESLKVGFLGIFIALMGGLVLGISTTFLGGWVDNLTQRAVEVVLAFPVMLLLLSIVAILGPSLSTVLIALGISSIPGYTRLVRGSVISVKSMEYITAARVMGVSDLRIMTHYILPNVLGPILIYGTLGLSSAILVTAGLSYIGLGAQPPSPEWGAMLSYGRNFLSSAWWMSVFPGIAIFITVLGINLFGDGLRDALDPKSR
jgi:peptide/nickel transport system permease protein